MGAQEKGQKCEHDQVLVVMKICKSIQRIHLATVGKSTMRLMLGIAVREKWTIETTDVKSTFLHGSEIERDVYLKPLTEACLAHWKLVHCLQGAVRHFYKSVAEQLETAGCQQSGMDPGLSFKAQENQMYGIVAFHVDAFLYDVKPMFKDTVIRTLLHQRFLAGEWKVATLKRWTQDLPGCI